MIRDDQPPFDVNKSIQGLQAGARNVQGNFFAPVTANLFAGPFDRLRDACFDPISLERDLDLGRFTGREWLIDRIDSFIASHSHGYVLIMGEAGVGKSALAAHLVGTRPWLHHFTRLPGGRSPVAARKSLAAQVIARWKLHDWAPGGMLPAAADRSDWFDRLLFAAAHIRNESEPSVPIVLVVDGMDEAELSAEGGLPLGLPASLPDGVFIVATSRFGIDRALHAVRHPADWLKIEVEGTDNLRDMGRFLTEIINPVTGDRQLTDILAASGVGRRWFVRTLSGRCAGVWIYLRYVLDEIRHRRRDPFLVSRLPGDLAGYYAEQVERWRGDPDDDDARKRWDRVILPLLGMLGAARTSLTVRDLAAFAGVHDERATGDFVEETVRAFLSREDSRDDSPRYAIRHQSLRDLLTGVPPDDRPDVLNLARIFADQNERAHRSIVTALMPVNPDDGQSWHNSNSYRRRHLAAHAAAVGVLDELIVNPGFVCSVSPGSILMQRMRLLTTDGRRAVAAFEMSLQYWESSSEAERIALLAANSARVRAARLLTACTAASASQWPVQWAAWSGRSYLTLANNPEDIGDSGVLAVTVGRAGDRDVIVSGSADRTVRVWDAVTGELVGTPLSGHERVVNTVAIGRVGDRDVIVSGSADRTVRVWDAADLSPQAPYILKLRSVVYAVAIARVGARDMIVCADYAGTLQCWDAATGELAWSVPKAHDGSVLAIAIGKIADQDVVVSGADDGQVRLRSADTGQLTGNPLIDHRNANRDQDVPVEAVTIGQAGDRNIVVSASGGKVRIWDAVTGDLADTPFTAHVNTINAVTTGRAGHRDVIVTGSADGTVRVWDAAFADPSEPALIGHDDAVTAVVIGRVQSRDLVVSGSDDGTIRFWDPLSGDPVGHAIIGQDFVSALAIGNAADREVIVSGSYDGTIRVWDPVTRELVGSPLHATERAVYAVAVGRVADKDLIVSGSADGTVRAWDATTRDLVGSSRHEPGRAVYAAVIGRIAGKDVIISGSADGTIRVWDPVGREFGGPPLHATGHTVYAVAIGRIAGKDAIVSGSADGAIQLWDPVTRNPIGLPMQDSDWPINSIVIGRAQGQDVIVAGSGDGTIRVWNAIMRQLMGSPLDDHDEVANAVAIGRVAGRDVIVSGSGDRTIFLRAAYSVS